MSDTTNTELLIDNLDSLTNNQFSIMLERIKQLTKNIGGEE